MNELLSANWYGLSYRQVQDRLREVRSDRVLKDCNYGMGSRLCAANFENPCARRQMAGCN